VYGRRKSRPPSRRARQNQSQQTFDNQHNSSGDQLERSAASWQGCRKQSRNASSGNNNQNINRTRSPKPIRSTSPRVGRRHDLGGGTIVNSTELEQMTLHFVVVSTGPGSYNGDQVITALRARKLPSRNHHPAGFGVNSTRSVERSLQRVDLSERLAGLDVNFSPTAASGGKRVEFVEGKVTFGGVAKDAYRGNRTRLELFCSEAARMSSHVANALAFC
jgi:hypothetical protein